MGVLQQTAPIPSPPPRSGTASDREGMFARRAPGIQINVLVVYPNALPLDITPSSSPGTLSTNDTTKHNYR